MSLSLDQIGGQWSVYLYLFPLYCSSSCMFMCDGKSIKKAKIEIKFETLFFAHSPAAANRLFRPFLYGVSKCGSRSRAFAKIKFYAAVVSFRPVKKVK